MKSIYSKLKNKGISEGEDGIQPWKFVILWSLTILLVLKIKFFFNNPEWGKSFFKCMLCFGKEDWP